MERKRPDRYDPSISIHALREEGDTLTWHSAKRLLHFYPRPPRGGRLHRGTAESGRTPISIHALREEGDCKLRRTGHS